MEDLPVRHADAACCLNRRRIHAAEPRNDVAHEEDLGVNREHHDGRSASEAEARNEEGQEGETRYRVERAEDAEHRQSQALDAASHNPEWHSQEERQADREGRQLQMVQGQVQHLRPVVEEVVQGHEGDS